MKRNYFPNVLFRVGGASDPIWRLPEREGRAIKIWSEFASEKQRKWEMGFQIANRIDKSE